MNMAKQKTFMEYYGIVFSKINLFKINLHNFPKQNVITKVLQSKAKTHTWNNNKKKNKINKKDI